jgi:ligand-binding sensor domain-containing protein/serine phosphatase RsbU (regulator of sigma subunit)
MKKNIFILSFLCLYLFPFMVKSQTSNISKPNFEIYTIINGLSQNNVTCTFQDSKGFLWIGTQAGLNRYDGKYFDVYKNDPEDTLSLSDNMIYGISEDINQNIWIATENGLNKYNRETNNFISYFYNKDNEKQSISDNLIYNVYCDNDGNIWIKTPESFDKINPLTNEIKKYNYDKSLFVSESDNYKHPIYQDKEGTLWFGTRDGLGYFNSEADEIIFFKHDQFDINSISNNEIRAIYEDSQQNLWIGTNNGLNLFNTQTRKFTSHYYSKENATNSINGLIEGNNNDLWITTNNDGLINFSPTNLTFTNFIHSNIENSISTNQTNCIIKDNSNILWIGTRNGLNKLDIKPKKFDVLTNKSNLLETYENSTSIFASSKNVIIGTKFNGIYVYDKESKTSINYSFTKKNYPDDFITSIYPFNKNEVIISGDNSLMVYSFLSKKFESIYLKFPNLKGFETYNKRIRCVYIDTEKNIWIGTSCGVFEYNYKLKNLNHFDNIINKQPIFPSSIINCIYEDNKKNIWIGTEKGISILKYGNKNFSKLNYTENLHIYNIQNKIYCILEDKIGYYWIATNSGLFKYNIEDNKSTFYTEKNGLPNNQIFGLLEHEKTIWISTSKGLAYYDIKLNLFKRFYPSDGIQCYEFSPNVCFKAEDGYMYFGGNQGINAFHPDSIFDNPIIPNLELLKIIYYSNNEKTIININEKKLISLPWQNNTVSISFAALEFTQPFKNQYKYILEGLDNEWHNIENQTSINFSNLPSGKYTLKIIGSNNDLVWSKERILDIIVETPIWKTIWAYVLYIIIFIVLLFVFIESRTSSLKKVNKTLTEKQEAAYEIAKQKEELIVKNKNITDSITYAKRIQWAIMPSRAKFKQLLPESCILYMPKDIVSGDFYWITEIQDKIFIAAVDCTGHGVPGAFMSIIGYDLLRNITKERKIHKPSEILDYLNKALIELLTKNEMEDDAVKDGMDMSICVYHKTKGILEFAGAFNPLYIIRNNKIMTIKGDRFSVGLGNEHEDVPFKNHIIKVQKGDTFYLFTDGYADQFGGEFGKKMKFRRFRHTILSVYSLPFTKQVKGFKEHFNEWKGDLEQIDDILILGFKLDNYLDAMYREIE